MRRKALIAALCWLMMNEASAKVVQTAYGVGFLDNISAESAPRLYRDVPVGVYASATPYAAYSFQAPTFAAPKGGQVIPVKEESVMVQNSNGYLKDSYGQRFVEAPQTIAYKAIFPQQFVQLQNLPAHLSQPLTAATNFQYGQGAPHFFQQSQFRTPTLQTLAPSTLQQYTSSQPFGYGNNLRSFAPSYQIQGHPTQQQSTSNKNVYVNNLTAEQFSKLQNEPKFQRLQEAPNTAENNKQSQSQSAPLKKIQLVQVPKQTSITTVTNGKKTVVNLITKPPVPLLDLTLLEPLTFDNPLVPQVQHFLPRINQVTYKKLPEINEVKKHQMEFIVQNTKSYDSGAIKKKPKNDSPKKKTKQHEEIDEIEVHPTPTLTIQEIPEDSPEISYEINSPNYKETISEKKISYNKKTESEPVSISYNKQTQKDPVHYSYEKRTEKKPVHYSYTHSSKEPAKFKKAHNEISDDQPKQLIYHFNDEDKSNHSPKQHHQPAPVPRESESPHNENSEETDREEAPQQNERDDDRQEYYDEAPKSHYYNGPEHKEQTYQQNENDESADLRNEAPRHDAPRHGTTHNEASHHESPRHQSPRHEAPRHETPRHEAPRHEAPRYEAPRHEVPRHEAPRHETPRYEAPRHETPHHKAPRHETPHHKAPRHETPRHATPQKSEKLPQNIEHIEAIVPEYEEDITILSSHKPHAPIQSEHHEGRHHNNKHHQKPEPQHEQHEYYDYPKSHYAPSSDERDHSERIIIKEGTTAEVHKPNEELMDKMVQKQEENEEDFEKAYKDAAFGFPAYDAPFHDVEKEIYNPDSYGSSRYHNNYNVEKSPLRQYEADGDDFPKYTRSQYKDARDKTNDEYFLDYAVSRPESLAERYKKKEDYYKVYTQHKPENYFGNENNKNQKAKHTASSLHGYYAKPQQKQQSSKYRVAPQFEEYNYKKEAPRDNSAYATLPAQFYKVKTQFVEPQYQYGFEPLSIPRLLDSELAAMASNHSPESERPGRKKDYLNWHFKKTNFKSGS